MAAEVKAIDVMCIELTGAAGRCRAARAASRLSDVHREGMVHADEPWQPKTSAERPSAIGGGVSRAQARANRCACRADARCISALIARLPAAADRRCASAGPVNVPYLFGKAFYQEQFLALVLGLALVLAFNARRLARQAAREILAARLRCSACSVSGAGIWIAIELGRLLPDVPYRTPEMLVAQRDPGRARARGTAARHRLGPVQRRHVLLRLRMVAHLMPMACAASRRTPRRCWSISASIRCAIFGTPLVVGATIVIMYIWLGELLIQRRRRRVLHGHRRWPRWAAGAAARPRSAWSARRCSARSRAARSRNVASVGVFTIPMMKRTGYSARDAGAIEAVASTGGQLMPPVMGAAAFLMAEFIEVPYAEVALAATIPAMLYYLGPLLAGRPDRRPGQVCKRLTDDHAAGRAK